MFARFLAFLRDFLPSHKSHFLFLFGLVLLRIASSSDWLPPFDPSLHLGQRGSVLELLKELQPVNPELQRIFEFLRSLLLAVAFCAALPLLLLRVEQPARKLITCVVLPLCLAVAQFAALMYLRTTVPPFPEDYRPFDLPPPLGDWLFFLQNSPGFTLALLSLALMSVATWRAHRGLTSLPIRFHSHPNDRVVQAPESHTSKRIVLFLAASLLYPQLIGPPLFLLGQWLQRIAPFLFQSEHMWLSVLVSLPFQLPYVLLMFWILAGTWRELRNLFRPGRFSDYGFVLGVLLLAISVPRFLFYLWVEFHSYIGSGEYPSPQFVRTSFLATESFWQTWLQYAIPGFLMSQVIYRGLLQPRLVHQFGLRRGLFVLCSLAVATNSLTVRFQSEFLYFMVIGLGATVLSTLLLGWLFERSHSIWPVLLLDFAFRMSLLSFGGASNLFALRGLAVLEILYLAFLAHWLFKRFPPHPPLSSEPVFVSVPSSASSPPPQSLRLPPPHSDQ